MHLCIQLRGVVTIISPLRPGYLKFGFNREKGVIVYREWAPAAQ